MTFPKLGFALIKKIVRDRSGYQEAFSASNVSFISRAVRTHYQVTKPGLNISLSFLDSARVMSSN